MRPIVHDATVYIEALRSGSGVAELRRSISGAPVWLSAVVLEELYAGTSASTLRIIDRLERDFERMDRILVPNKSDWATAGKVLSRLAAELGYESVGRGRLTNDALLAVSAGRIGALIITTNRRDFARLAQFWPFLWKTPQA